MRTATTFDAGRDADLGTHRRGREFRSAVWRSLIASVAAWMTAASTGAAPAPALSGFGTDIPNSAARTARYAEKLNGTDPQARLWSSIQEFRDARQPEGEALFAPALRCREQLADLVDSFLTQFPGADRRDEAIQIELQNLFEIGSLSGGEYDRLRRRIVWYMRAQGSAATHEAAYWATVIGRCAGATAPAPAGVHQTSKGVENRSTSAPAATLAARSTVDSVRVPRADADIFFARRGESEKALTDACRRYVDQFPSSRHSVRLIQRLYEQARKCGDAAEAARLAGVLKAEFPGHAVTQAVAGDLRRLQAIGERFAFGFATSDGRRIDSQSLAGRPVLIVVWSGLSATTRTCVHEVEEFQRARPELAIIGVNLDDSQNEMLDACRQLNVNWPQFNDGLGPANAFAREWGVDFVPFVFVVDRDGLLVEAAADDAWKGAAARVTKN